MCLISVPPTKKTISNTQYTLHQIPYNIVFITIALLHKKN